jgi:hypothetical protein
VFFYQWLCHKVRPCHLHPKTFGLVASGYDAAIIVAEYNNGTIPKLGFE